MEDKNHKRLLIANALKQGKVPELVVPGWNEEAPLFYYQKTGVAWLYVTPKALLADSTGTGKTAHGLALLQRLKTQGRLGPDNRAVVICPARSVLGSWKADGFDFFVPHMKVAIAKQRTKAKRMEVYADPSWEVLLINYDLVLRDIEILEPMGFKYAILDEVHNVRNHETKTAQAVKRITIPCKRVVGMSATPIQNHLGDIHGIMEVLGLGYRFGDKKQFERRHHAYKLVKVYYGGQTHEQKKLVGYKNTKLLKAMMEPYYLRRSYDDIEADIPELQSQEIWLELTPKQEKLYNAIKDKTVAKVEAEISATGANINLLRNAALRLRQLCTTTATLMDVDHSSKLDWLLEKLQGDWQDEKVIVFSNWKPSLKATILRLQEAGIGCVVVTGDESHEARETNRQKFWHDPKTRVLLGTTAIEESLNLQCARIQVNLDMLWNPARHGQLAGRHRRVGSKYDNVYVFSLLTSGTIEEGMMNTLKRKQALSDHMFDEKSQLFGGLTAQELLRLIRS